MNNVLHTKWGTAKINDNGYYIISSSKEGYHNKKLHRLIYEEFYGVKLHSEISIHHKNENKLDNCILNLEAMLKSEHHKLHNSGGNNPMYSKHHSMESNINHSASQNNSTNYFRVTKQKNSTYKQGFAWNYKYYDESGNRKGITSSNLNKLKEKVLNRGLPWLKLDEVCDEVTD